MDTKTYQRMIAEFRQLTNRIDKLNVFTVTDIYYSLPLYEKAMIMDQLQAMCRYHESLADRIEYYEKGVDNDNKVSSVL